MSESARVVVSLRVGCGPSISLLRIFIFWYSRCSFCVLAGDAVPASHDRCLRFDCSGGCGLC